MTIMGNSSKSHRRKEDMITDQTSVLWLWAVFSKGVCRIYRLNGRNLLGCCCRILEDVGKELAGRGVLMTRGEASTYVQPCCQAAGLSLLGCQEMPFQNSRYFILDFGYNGYKLICIRLLIGISFLLCFY